jgi:hypothetical protein
MQPTDERRARSLVLVQLHLPTVMLSTTELLWTWRSGDESFRMHVTNPRLIESLDAGGVNDTVRGTTLYEKMMLR